LAARKIRLENLPEIRAANIRQILNLIHEIDTLPASPKHRRSSEKRRPHRAAADLEGSVNHEAPNPLASESRLTAQEEVALTDLRGRKNTGKDAIFE
jgi:hypothetical protein